MNGETWTEYAVRWPDGTQEGGYGRRDRCAIVAEAVGATLVGRTVTATPWLPVQDQP